MIPQSHFRVYIQKNWKQVSKQNLYTHIHSSIIQSSQEVEATQCPLMNEWKNKMLYLYNGILFSLNKERNLVTCFNMNCEDVILSEICQS